MTDYFQSSSAHWKHQTRRLANIILDFVFPPVCAHCKKPGALICSDCLAAIPWLTEPICSHCGRVVSRPMLRCAACQKNPLFPLERVRAATIFANPIPDLIHQLKYNGLFALAEPLAGLMVEAWSNWKIPVDLVVAVPLHPDREKKRGYNQSDLLVTHFCKKLNLEKGVRALQRIRNTPPQVGLNASNRQLNVANAFQADPNQVAGKDVVLVDDVCTTGSTLKAGAEALLAAGAGRVSGYCLARAL